MANVFISHRRIDKDRAEQLAAELRTAGHKVWFDEWEIGVGDSIVGEMNKGLAGASYIVLCYSTAMLTSPYMAEEWESTLARQLDGKPVKLLPVLLTGGTPPALLAHRKYADLVKDWDVGVAELLRAIR